MLLSFFGPDGKGQLDLKHFSDFCRALHAELVRLEYLHYDYAKKVGLTSCFLEPGQIISCSLLGAAAP